MTRSSSLRARRDQKTDDRDHEQTDIHLLDRERAPGAPDQVSEPAFGAHHFGDGDQNEADADSELEAGHDHRQRARQRNCPERVPAIGFVVLADVEIDLVDLEHAGGGVDHHREEHADRHHEDLRCLAEAEDQQRQRKDCALGDRIGRRDQRIEEGADRPVEPHGDAEHQRRDAAEDGPIEQALHAHCGVGDEFAACATSRPSSTPRSRAPGRTACR